MSPWKRLLLRQCLEDRRSTAQGTSWLLSTTFFQIVPTSKTGKAGREAWLTVVLLWLVHDTTPPPIRTDHDKRIRMRRPLNNGCLRAMYSGIAMAVLVGFSIWRHKYWKDMRRSQGSSVLDKARSALKGAQPTTRRLKTESKDSSDDEALIKVSHTHSDTHTDTTN